jgi:hypothetical protein
MSRMVELSLKFISIEQLNHYIQHLSLHLKVMAGGTSLFGNSLMHFGKVVVKGKLLARTFQILEAFRHQLRQK